MILTPADKLLLTEIDDDLQTAASTGYRPYSSIIRRDGNPKPFGASYLDAIRNYGSPWQWIADGIGFACVVGIVGVMLLFAGV